MMPDLTGMDLHAELARLVPAQAGQMVFMTGGTFTSAGRTFLDEVNHPRVEKPFDMDALRGILRRSM